MTIAMAKPDKLIPVTLQCWPICSDCLSWSEDDLAVAGNESVYILTPKRSLHRPEAAGHSQWRVVSLRVNLFRQDEWAEQTAATIKDFSIGEELSNSHIVGLAWSKAGLAMHRRSVLAVLTSNLVLSLWEADGIQTEYQRTCIVNKCSAQKDECDRRSLRIRSFAWMPLLKTAATLRWGLHFLVVADDHDNVKLLHVSKSNASSGGSWGISIVLQLNVKEMRSHSQPHVCMSPLQQRLYYQSPIQTISVSPWSREQMRRRISADSEPKVESSIEVHVATLTVRKAVAIYTEIICASLSSDGQQASINTSRYYQREGYTISSLEPLIVASSSSNNHSIEISHNHQPSPEEDFNEALQPIRDNFNSTFQLFGHLRTRFWGSAVSADGTKSVACVTLHPSDMIEYTIPSAERCTLVFKHTGQMIDVMDKTSQTTTSVQKGILQFACDTLKYGKFIANSMDEMLLHTYVGLASHLLKPDSALRNSLILFEQQLLVRTSNGNNPDETRNDGSDQAAAHHSLFEYCEVCGAIIAFTKATEMAICTSGHQFSRCQLSFLAIQEPGISKYCSECGKQFLDLGKLGAEQGPSFTQAIFEEFDICPYCQAKFRG